ncbi:ribosome biogenesis protein MAK21 [Emericellopsis atlantica]|uniref:Ribosome biogenesis protein MAK21 n=1 Tax=Emericellopsis atlantica TaxID=2614577 RepID=A0A9P8CNX3_9HYPO|nr:ribosome biogenesis protein MAK21 [Emericellopsis atlantica]KAG9253587.1 ribosome biogenesis protein MAK21 [Emericellopsis atlantica]
MAAEKKKGKPQKGPQGKKPFNEAALAQLTSSIDQKLNGKAAAGSDHKRKNPPSSNETGGEIRKRQRNSSTGPAKASPKGKNGARSGGMSDEKKALLDEILALGGDEEDLKLIEDIDSSDDEYVKDTRKPVDKKLKDELAALSKELGFAEYAPSEASEPEVEDEAVDDDGEEDEDSQVSAEEDGADDEDVVQAPRKPEDMILQPRADWHIIRLPKLPKPVTEQVGPFTPAMEALKRHAETLLESDAAKYRSSKHASSSHKFLSTIMSSGTLNDKVSALTLAIQESPLHNIKAFDALMSLASKKSRAQAIGAIGAIVDLCGPGSLLPSERRLRTFMTQPGLIGTLQKTSTKSWSPEKPLPGQLTPMHLVSWAFEDWLKATYFKVLQLLEVWCSDEIEYSRSRALDFVYGLLKDKPEQESNLLRLLVNKLGDRDRKIASRASYLVLQMQISHPGMKQIIIQMIHQEILLHPSQDHRSKYYAINTLNQTILSNRESQIAESLMGIYFELFVTLLKGGSLGAALQVDYNKPENGKPAKPTKPGAKGKAGEPTEQDIDAADKLVSAILTGVNRAAPFVGTNDTIMEAHMDTLFKIAHSANFNTGIQALLLIQHLSTARSLGTDRFYRTLYESLLDPRLITSSKQSLYLNLLLRALKNDVDVRRVKAFAKRMLQMTHLHQPAFVCGLLYVVAHLQGTFPDLKTLINEPEESIFDDDSENRPVYDGRKRDPEYSNAQRSCLWELIPVLAHYHPSVSAYATSALEQNAKATKPDLDSHSLIRFLDKFVYKQPKATDSARGVSIMQPLKATKDLGDIWLGSRAAGAAPTSVNSATFKDKKSEDVAAEDVFFHKYFQQAGKEGKKPAKKTAGAGADDEEGAEDEIWKALVAAQPDIEGDDDSEGFDDLDDDEMASDDEDDDEEGAFDLDDDDMEVDTDSEGGVDIEGTDDEAEEAEDSDGLVAVEEDPDKAARDEAKEKRKNRRKELKGLPTFASVDDYAELLGQEPDEDFT